MNNSIFLVKREKRVQTETGESRVCLSVPRRQIKHFWFEWHLQLTVRRLTADKKRGQERSAADILSLHCVRLCSHD